MMYVVVLLLGLSHFHLQASDQHYYQKGKELADAKTPIDLSNPRVIEEYQGTQIPESQLTPSTLPSTLQNKLKAGHQAHQALIESQQERLSYQLDPQNDSLFKDSDQIINNSLETLKATATESTTLGSEKKTRHTCTQPGAPYEMSCTRTLQIKTVQKTKTYAYTHVKGGSWFLGPKDAYDYIQKTPLPEEDSNEFIFFFHRKRHVKNYYTYTKQLPGKEPILITEEEYNATTLKPEDFEEVWIDDCQDLESRVDQNHCSYGERQCIQGPATQIINGFEVTKPCWQEQQTYHCNHPTQDTCGTLQWKGCVQIGSRCQEKVGNTCVAYEQTYECTEKKDAKGHVQFTGQIPWCLDGNCVEQNYAPNTDMASALSKLSIFKEMQKDMKDLAIFKGEIYGCNRSCISFKDCCGSGSGWGVSLGLASCSETEKALAKLRTDQKCVFVGTYCAERFLGLCIRKKSNYCCFGSKMARLFQTQGRQQLGLNFGEAKNPQCRGFQVEELVKLDFDRFDMSELFSDLYAKFKSPDIHKLSQEMNHDWQHRTPQGQCLTPHKLKSTLR